jgi:uncharacterized protein (DUF1330 family)
MTIHVLLDNTIHDTEKYAKYVRAVPRLIAKHGGIYLARRGKFEDVAGEWKPNRIGLFK